MDADASMCRDGLLPAVLSSLLLWMNDNGMVCGCREVSRGRCASTSRHTNQTHHPVEKRLPKSKLTGQVRRCLWRRGRRGCPPKPADTRCLFLLMRGGGLYGGMTECRREDGSVLVVRQCMAIRKEKRGNAAVQSAHA